MDKKYIFNLQSVLNHRLTLEELKKKELASVINLLKKEEDKELKIESEINDKVKELSIAQNGKFHSYDFFRYNSYLTLLRTNSYNQRKKIDKLKIEVEEKRNNLIEATKNRKVIEKLKETGKHKFLLNNERLEQIFLDDIAISKFITAEDDF